MTPKEVIDTWLGIAVREDVSDTHLVEGIAPMFRKQGVLQSIPNTPVLKSRDIELMAHSICDDVQWHIYEKQGEVDLAYDLKGKARFRVNIFRQKETCSIAFRKIPIKIPKLEDLKMPEVLKSCVKKSQGLFLVTGPTGSGKSTTLAAMLDYLNSTEKVHILTLEDPIEYVHNHKQSLISQREIGRDTESFGNALRAALRQDPDVILVGEMRDFETISIALTAAETGHLVLGTLHTSSAPSTIDRIIDVFPPEQQSQISTQLAGALIGILSQRLLPTLEGKRVAATEVMINTKGISSLIRSGKIHQIFNMMQMGNALGMHTMESSIKKLVESKKISIDLAEKYIEGK